jgi:hypothetical protein
MFGRPDTAPWHFIDIPVRETVTQADMPKFCPGHNCVTEQIQIATAAVKNGAAPRKIRLEALKFLAHLVGDLHQPLHCSDDGDRGGNEKLVRYRPNARGRGRKLKLHAFWDHLAEIKTSDKPRELATQLRLTKADRETLSRGSVYDWAWESHLLARDVVYPGFEAGPTTATNGIPLPDDYHTPKIREVVVRQLQRAGARLARLLNEALGT